MEIMAHYFYSSAMAEWAWMGERLDYASLLGYALSLEFNYYVCYLFTYGFAGALAKAEGIEIPGHRPLHSQIAPVLAILEVLRPRHAPAYPKVRL
ncbi:hypothetical protein MTO96_007130 [Rhipicephalus appendiculatus]